VKFNRRVQQKARDTLHEQPLICKSVELGELQFPEVLASGTLVAAPFEDRLYKHLN